MQTNSRMPATPMHIGANSLNHASNDFVASNVMLAHGKCSELESTHSAQHTFQLDSSLLNDTDAISYDAQRTGGIIARACDHLRTLSSAGLQELSMSSPVPTAHVFFIIVEWCSAIPKMPLPTCKQPVHSITLCSPVLGPAAPDPLQQNPRWAPGSCMTQGSASQHQPL